MLDDFSDHDVTPTDDSATDVAEPAAAPPRRRRAASRPAGPPEALADQVAEQEALPVGDTPPAEAAETPVKAKRATTRRTTKKAAVEPVESAPAADEAPAASDPEPAPRTRRRATRKAAEPDPIDASADSEEGEELDPEAAAAALAELAATIAADSPESDDEANAEDTDEDEDEGGGGRRRRRRGGRRRRRGGDRDDASESGESSEDADDEAGESSEASDSDEDSEGDGTRRRRRRRRRRGESSGGTDDDPGEVVVRVREPRRSRSSSRDEVTGIEGSTRMEAKRQRRREGRAAGRRRTPILSESEFLARREAVTRRMVIRQRDDYTQLAVLEDDILVEHYVDRASASSLIGNIYLGRVQNVLPSMEAVFIDIGRGRNAVLYAGEVDWDALGAQGDQRKVDTVFKSGQTVLVQVSKDPVGAKGARLTGHIAIPGRYVVYSPGGHLAGISRKLADTERNRLKSILSDLIDDSASVIVRTAAEGASEEELIRDVNRLKAQWQVIETKIKQGSAPQQLYAEPDLTVRIVRDLFTEDFVELVVAGNGGPNDVGDSLQAYVDHVAQHLKERLTIWNTAERGDPFAQYRVDEQIAKALERKVFLPSGGSLVIDRTEAMTVIDVNTGKFTGAGGNLEATVTSNNLEAAEEVVRQLRLRDIGGIIVIDFIDMVLPSNRELLVRRLVECLGRDRTRHQVAEVTSLGLVQMTRKKIGTGLAEAFTEQCDHCAGRGYMRFPEPVESQAPADGGERSERSGRGGRGGSDRASKNGSERAPKPSGERGSRATGTATRRGRGRGKAEAEEAGGDSVAADSVAIDAGVDGRGAVEQVTVEHVEHNERDHSSEGETTFDLVSVEASVPNSEGDE